jgi:hypothetical protein
MDVHWDNSMAVMWGEMRAALRVLPKAGLMAESWASKLVA